MLQQRRAATLSSRLLNVLPPTGTMTKVVCTLGPSTDQAPKVAELLSNGMHVARLNFSHAGTDYSYPNNLMELVRSTAGHHYSLAAGSMLSDTHDELPKNLRAILVDTKGPEIRTGPLQSNKEVIQIEEGDSVELTIHNVSEEPLHPEGTHRIHVDYKSIAKTMNVGGLVLLDDGLIALEVADIDANLEYVTCVALNGGPIKKNKGVNLPGMELDLPALTEKDKADMKWACEVGADFVAASFIRTAANVRSVIAYLDRCILQLPQTKEGKTPLRPLVISKIESKEGVDNFFDILAESDGIMVARGDLGVEIPYSKVFKAQKVMVEACNKAGKPVIVATQMLDSMIRNPRPTRAEVTDVGTAVLDGTDAVMLSGETAAGKYPIESLKAMGSVVWEADRILDSQQKLLWNQDLHDSMNLMDQELDAVAASAVKSASKMNAKMIILITMSGRVARAVARHRPSVPVLAFCTDPQVGRRLQLHRAITPIMLQSPLDPGAIGTPMGLLRAEAVRTAKELGFAKAGDRIIMVDRTAGRTHDMHNYAHNMKVVTLR
jgi:pyruvate kinase